MEKNNKQLGIPYKEPDLPDAAPYEQPKPSNEPVLEFGDRVQVVLKVLKSGIVRVKVNGTIATMYEKYYKQVTDKFVLDGGCETDTVFKSDTTILFGQHVPLCIYPALGINFEAN